MNILVADVSSSLRLAVSSIVHELGHTVWVASDEEEAWDVLQKHRIEVLIHRWCDKSAEGLNFCKRVRSGKFNHFIYIVLLFEEHIREHLLDAMEAGADGFARIPISSDDIRIRLKSASRIHSMEHALEDKSKALQLAQDRINKDLEDAALAQISVLPKPIRTGKIRSEWFYKPATDIGGDTFGYYETQNDCLVFYSLDVSGHGISAAMMSMSLQPYLGLKRGLYGGPVTPERLHEIPALFARNLNDHIIRSNLTEHYLTMIFGIINTKTNEIYFVQAGHPHLFLLKKSRREATEVEVNGFPIGLTENAMYETQKIQVGSGDRLIIYSDGICDNRSAINNQFLEGQNLLDHMNSVKSLDSEGIINAVRQQWLKPEQLNNLPDDVSFLIFEFMKDASGSAPSQNNKKIKQETH